MPLGSFRIVHEGSLLEFAAVDEISSVRPEAFGLGSVRAKIPGCGPLIPRAAAFLTDAIIVQRYIEVESRLLRVMAVVKVRASPHSDELRLFTIDDGGIRMGEMLPDQEGLLGGRPTRKRAAELLVSATDGGADDA